MLTVQPGAAGGRTAPYEPPPPPPTYTPPPATVDPDPTKGWIRRLLPVLRPHRGIMLGSLAASVSMLGLQVAIPQVLRAAVDNALVQRTTAVGPYVAAIVVLGAGFFLLGYVQRFGLQRASVEIECHLRALLFEHLGKQSFTFYDTVQSGQLISRANSDIRSIQMFLAFAPMIAVSMLSFVAAIILMVQMHLLLTLVAASTLPIVYFAGMAMRTRLFPISWMLMARAADIATIVEENVTGIRVVKSFVAEKSQLSVFERAARRMRWVAIKQVDNQAQFSPVMQNLPRVSMALLLLYGGYLVIHGGLTLGTFLAFNSYVVMLQAPFMMIGFLMMMAQRSAASAQRVLEVLDQQPEIVDRPGAFDLIDCEGDVHFRDVDFAYGGTVSVLRDFSLHLRPGETVALVGRTGCGKSTVARLIPRFYDLTGGAVEVDGVDVRDYTVRSLRSHIGLVLDEPFLFSESIADNIAFGRPDASFDDIEAAARAAGADDFIRNLADGYDTVIGERGYTLSGGQRQRIAIARTLLVNPRILILDDATSSIDAQREFEIHGALRTLMRGRTTLIIAHRLSTISLADRVVVMEDGHIVADGTHESLMRDFPLYTEILARADADHEDDGDEEEKKKKVPLGMRPFGGRGDGGPMGDPMTGLPGDGMPGGGRGGF